MENSFGSFLKQKRQEKRLTQKELAGMLFVSESAVSKWEQNVARPDIALLPALSQILEVSEHELITASIDTRSREEKAQARKWRIFSASWSLFFYIAYTVALIPCFICNLAIGKTLSWFWIVLASLLLAFTFTNLPSLIKRHKLILLTLSMYLALCVLLATCALYTGGDWFWIPVLSVLLGLLIVFTPIYIAKYDVFARVRKYNDFISVAVDFVMLNILLGAINVYTAVNGYASIRLWYFSIALPIVVTVYLILNLFLCVRFLRINKLLKTSVILSMVSALYVPVGFIKVKNPALQAEIDDANIFAADFSNWQSSIFIERNVHCIVFLSLLGVAAIFLLAGLLYGLKKKHR